MINLKKRYEYIIGVDEVNVMSMLGPIVACCYCRIKQNKIKGVKDSKLLSTKRIRELAEKLKKEGLYAIGICRVSEIDNSSIFKASILAKERAINNFVKKYKKYTKMLFIIDGLIPVSYPVSQITLPDADRYVYEVSAASIIAKDVIEKYFEIIDKKYPGIRKLIAPTRQNIEKAQNYLPNIHIRKSMLKIGINKKGGEQ